MKAKQTANDEERELARLEAAIKRNETKLRKNTEKLRSIQLTEEIEKSVRELIQIAEEENAVALAGLAKIATDATAALNGIVKKRPGLILPFSQNLFAWPGFISHKRAITEDNAELLKQLELGKGGLYYNRPWQPHAPSTRAALGFYFFAQDLRAAGRLPPLTQNSKRQWFEESWKLSLADGFLPEQSDLLAPLGKSATGKAALKRANKRGMSKQTAGMKRDDMRAEIKRRVWEAFNKVVAAPKRK